MPPEGAQAGSLSYVARPADGFTLIAIDSGRYSVDNTSTGTAEHETSGQMSAGREKWVLKQIKEAKDRGDTVPGMQHHGMAEHFTMEEVLPKCLIDDYSRIANNFADTGMGYIFTWHMHADDIAKVTTDTGNILYDIETGSMLTYPSPTRAVTLSKMVNKDNGYVKENMDIKTITHAGPAVFVNPLTGKSCYNYNQEEGCKKGCG